MLFVNINFLLSNFSLKWIRQYITPLKLRFTVVNATEKILPVSFLQHLVIYNIIFGKSYNSLLAVDNLGVRSYTKYIILMLIC